MAVSISKNRQVVSLTWRSAAHFAWHSNPWMVRPLMAVLAFFRHFDKTQGEMNTWVNQHKSCQVSQDYRRAIYERTIASSVATQTEDERPPGEPAPDSPPANSQDSIHDDPEG